MVLKLDTGIAVLVPWLYQKHRQRRRAINPYTIYGVLHYWCI